MPSCCAFFFLLPHPPLASSFLSPLRFLSFLFSPPLVSFFLFLFCPHSVVVRPLSSLTLYNIIIMSTYRPSALFSSAFPILSIAEKGEKAGAFLDQKASEAKAGLQKAASAGDLKAQQAQQAVLEAAGKKPTGVDLYARFALAGALGCAITHGAATPMDVVKTKIQLEPKVYNKGVLAAARSIVAADGAGALLTGLGPTIVGYSIQGAFKFGGYEFWKKKAIDYYGVEAARENRQAIYLGASAIAEFFADVALCPLEAVRIRLVSQPTFANGLGGGFARIAREEGLGGFYAGFGPILFKQVPYTMAKFAVYEVAFEKICAASGKKPSELSEGTKTTYNLGAGLIAGLAAAFISQPADTLLSRMNKTKGAPGEGMVSRLAGLSKELGIKGLYGGMVARFVMIGSLTAGQFGLYGSIKSALGATGGVEIAKA